MKIKIRINTLKSIFQFNILGMFIMLIWLPANSQINNSAFYRHQKIDSSYHKDIKLSISHLSFNKDNEYFNKIADGYTLFGNQLSTTLIYYPLKNVRIEGGLYLRKDFGNNNYSEIAPLFSVKVKHQNLSFIFGTLEGSLNHNLIEPIYDFEKVMLNKNENGIQFLLNKNNFDLDLWINWEHMLYVGDTTQEKVSGGIVTETILLKTNNTKISLPFQFTAMHLGGQIDASPLPLTSVLNAATGIIFEKDFTSDFFHGLRFEPYILTYKDFSFTKTDAFDRGSALYLNLTIKTKLNNIMISYWQGNKYISTHGGLLYNSRSTTFKYSDYTEANRKLLILRFLSDFKLADNFIITSRFEPLYDFTRKNIEFSLGLYINYSDDFLLKNLGK